VLGHILRSCCRACFQPSAVGRLEETAFTATSSPAPAAAEAAWVTAVGGAGPVVLSPLMGGPLSVASAAVAVRGAGRGRAGIFSGSFPLGWPAVVARRRAEEVEDADCNLHVGAFIAMYRIRPPAGEEAVRQVADAAPVLP
jgi:hypothetical protein